MAASADLVVNIVTKLSGSGMDDATKSTSKFQSAVGTASKYAGAALLGIGAAAFKAANAAAEDAQSQALLANAMKNTAGASKSQIAATEDWIAAQAKATGVADDQLRPALAQLVRATGDVGKAQRDLKIAMDISAASGKPLESVTAAIAKGYSGNTGALSRLVPGLNKAALASGNFHRILKSAADMTHGAMAASAKTAAGQMRIFRDSLNETMEAAGYALLPALQSLMKFLVPMGHWAQDHGTMFTVIAGGVAALAVAIIALNVALKIYNTITAITAIVTESAWLAALGPILLVIAAVAAVVVVIVILWKKCAAFRAIVTGLWNAMKAGAQAGWNALKKLWTVATNVFGWIKSHWKLLAAILGGPFVAAAILIISNWGRIKSKAQDFISWIKSAWHAMVGVLKDAFNGVRQKVSDVMSACKEIVRGAVSVIKSVWQGIHDKAASVFDAVRSAWSNLMSALHVPASIQSALTAPFKAMQTAIDAVKSAVETLISALGRIHVPSIHLPHIPGTRMAPAPAVAGPQPVAAYSAPAAPLGRAGASAGAGWTVINVTGAIDPESTARQIRRILQGHDRRIGVRVS